MPSLGESHEQVVMGRDREVYDRRTLLSLSQSPLVHVPEALTALEEWYGAWRPYTPRGLPANYHGDLSNKRDARQRRGHDDRHRSEFTEGSRRFPTGKAGLVPASSTSRRTKLNEARKQDEPKEMAWRKTQDTESSDVPEWMANDSQAQRPSAPTPIAASGAGRVDSIQEFKMQMRAKERQQRGEAAEPAESSTAHRAMYQDMANDEDTDSQASRFARFFSPESSRNQEDKTTHTNAMNFDLFSLLQGKKDNSSSASTPQAEPSTAARVTSPALQKTSAVQRAAPAIVSHEQVVGSPSTQPRESMPMRAASQSDWTARKAATPEPVDAAASKASHAASGGPAPSAADLASMQVLMAKLMGGPPSLNASPREMPRRNVGMQDDGSSTHDASMQRAAPPVHSAFYEQMRHSPAHTQQRESPAMHSGMPMSPANGHWASVSGSNTPPRFSHRGPPPGLNAAVHNGAANAHAPPPGLYPGPNTGIQTNWPNRGMYNPPGLPPPPFPPGLLHGPPPPGMQVPPGIPYGMPGGMPPHQSSAQSTPQQAHNAPRWMPPMRQHDV
ncbi:hypothetical protein MYAM1_003849 [Malassezia yamatoensis]|uniref:Uncharacterized protein n=1 Tax=Malassezia yamatoensis TaxID=253288 RepID=A0AAJ5YWJ4_9BASI|nr:hypothetical protein MYAM1_003849 [Malassezia yamatoensis]